MTRCLSLAEIVASEVARNSRNVFDALVMLERSDLSQAKRASLVKDINHSATNAAHYAATMMRAEAFELEHKTALASARKRVANQTA